MLKWLKRIALTLTAIILLLVVGLVTIGPAYVEGSRNYVISGLDIPVSAETQEFHDSLQIVDWHADTLLWRRNILRRSSRGHLDLPRMREGNIGLQGFAVPTKAPMGPPFHRPADGFDRLTPLFMAQLFPPRIWNSLLERTLYMAGRLEKAERKSRGKFRVVRTRSQLDQLFADRAAGKDVAGGFLSLEGAHALEGDIANMDRLFDAGYRVIGLHHFFDNKAGGSLGGVEKGGLTDYGRDLITEIEKRGMVLDLAHSSPQVVEDALNYTDMPVIVSHSGLHSHCVSRRNVPDHLMQRVARSGGVVAIGFWAQAICDESPLSVADAIRASIDILGEDHVSIGSDFDGNVATSFDAANLSVLTEALFHVGLTKDQIAKVMGGNALRVLRNRLPD